jgi:exodeoxyribonuclease VII large subunit
MNMIDISHSEEIYTVSRLNREIRMVLEGSFPALWVEGEISNFAAPNSGHWYFSLKDHTAQVRCAMFRPQNRRLTFTPKDGMHVMIKARVSLYEGRGDFQLLADYMEEIGEGRLRQEFEALKKRLHEAGLFDVAHKKALPLFPKKIGVITSPTGAAIRDILSVLNRRYRAASVIIYPTLVQGDTAAATIVKAIQTANQRNECDVLILARGGGSLEDLWPFNEEKVAYAIHQSNLPIVSGVGHEIDTTIADFVADLRAATPTAAAELITPDLGELLLTLTSHKKQFTRLIKQKFQQLQNNIVWVKKHLQQQHPKRRLQEQSQELDLKELTLVRLQTKMLHDLQTKLQMLQVKLQHRTPTHRIRDLNHRINLQYQTLTSAIKKIVLHKQQLFANLAIKLDGLSPLTTLTRGFSIATRAKDNAILQNAKQVERGDKIHIQLMKGKLECTVDDIT